MNQKWLVLMLALLLCGCRNPEPPAQAGGVSVPAIAVTEPTDSVGFYVSNSSVEIATGGAVKAFPLNLTDCSGIRLLGKDILLFSGRDATTLTLLSGKNRHIKAQAELSCRILPDDASVLVDDRGISYVDRNSQLLVTLDHKLEEVSRIPLPEGCGTPALSADRRLLYYCNTDGLRVLNLETGLDRLLREITFSLQELTALHCGDSVIQCRVAYSDGSLHSLIFAADTGILLYEGTDHLQLWTNDDFYIARYAEDGYMEWLAGSRNTAAQLLVLDEEPAVIEPIPELPGLLTYSPGPDFSQLACYSLDSGTKYAQVSLSGCQTPRSPQWDASTDTLWFLAADPATGQDVLYSWTLDATLSLEDETYLQPRWSREEPDLDGLAQCSILAQHLSIRHGVHVLIWNDATAYEPLDYTLTSEYQVPLLRRRLEELDAALSCFPEGFLKEAASQTGSGRLTVCLVRSINGKAVDNDPERTGSLLYWDEDAKAYLAIATETDMKQHLYHELFHILDSRILSTCSAYDDWRKLNPKQFSYDPSYTSNRAGEGSHYLSEENRYFIDLHSMSSPAEDRARIMEYAMMEGQESLFRSAPMQAKLRKLCQGIRKAFGLEKETVTYRWEQYLEKPLTPSS